MTAESYVYPKEEFKLCLRNVTEYKMYRNAHMKASGVLKPKIHIFDGFHVLFIFETYFTYENIFTQVVTVAESWCADLVKVWFVW